MQETKQPLILADLCRETSHTEPGSPNLSRSWIGSPVYAQGKIIAYIMLEKDGAGYYQPVDAERLAVLAGQAGLALQNARLYEEAHQRAAHLEALNAVIGTAGSVSELDDLLKVTLEHTLQAIAADGGGIWFGEHRSVHNIPAELLSRFSTQVLSFILKSDQVTSVQDWQAISDGPVSGEIVDIARRCGIRSSLSVPILADGIHSGGLGVFSSQPRAWTEEEISLIKAISKQLGSTAQRLGLLAETKRRLAEVTLLSNIISLTAAADDLSTALTQVCTQAAQFFHAEQAGFALLNDEGTDAVVVAEYAEEGRPSALGVKIPVAGNPSMAYLLEHKSALVVEDAQSNPLLEPVHGIMRDRQVASVMIQPILLGDRVVGTLGLDHLTQIRFTTEDVALMENIARQISQTLERIQLFDTTRLHARQFTELAKLSESLNRQFTVDEVVRGIGEGAIALTEANRVGVYLRTPDDRAVCAWHNGLSQAYIQAIGDHLKSVPGGQMLRIPEPLFIPDAMLLPEESLLRQLAAVEQYHGIGMWPLMYEDQVIAAIVCYYDQPYAWSENQKEVMTAFSSQAAISLRNSRLFDETQRRATQQEAINAIIATAVTALDLPGLLDEVLDLTLQALGLERGVIWAHGELRLRGLPVEMVRQTKALGKNREKDFQAILPVSDWEAYQFENPQEAFAPLMNQHGFKASMTIPILAEGALIGGMGVVAGEPREWLVEEIALVEAVGKQLGSAVERINLLQKTQEQAMRVQQIMDTVPEGVVLLNADYQIVLANPAAWRHLAALAAGFESGQALTNLGNRPIKEFLHGPGDTPWHEIELPGMAKAVFEVAGQSLVTRTQNDGWVLVIHDVSQEREYQDRIQMQDRLATVGQLAAGIAHDFNNIMAAIVVYADLLSLEPNLTNASRDRLVIIQQQVQRATSLIRQILDFSRRSVMEQSSLDLLPFIKELDKLLARVLPETIHLELKYQHGSYLVRADPTRLQQAFINLALNSRDAMPEGGVLHFELSRFHLKPDDTRPNPDLKAGDWVRIMVNDTGTGIARDDLPHIFEPFFTTKPVGHGTGLGLAQVYGIIKQHDGSIEVHSQPGKGASFIIYLPALEINETQSLSSLEQNDVKGSGATVLLVEDDQAARDALRDLLEYQNYRVLTASNGNEALSVYSQSNPSVDLVVSDIVMPEMGGFDLYQALQQHQPQIKILFITGHPLDSENQGLLEKGRVHWLQKPFSIREFNQAVNSLSDS